MAKLLKGLALALIVIGLSACGSSEQKDGSTELAHSEPVNSVNKEDLINKTHIKLVEGIDTKIKEKKQMIITGQILYQTFEGGFYGFIANNGDKYMPSGLKSEHRKNGLIVEMKVELITDRATTQQFGKLVKVLEIKVLDASKVFNTNPTM
ncbi:MAG: hypothetical protein ACJAVV_000562 [Alphaproteobacteria bacterium]|jgi:hypothetical protein